MNKLNLVQFRRVLTSITIPKTVIANHDSGFRPIQGLSNKAKGPTTFPELQQCSILLRKPIAVNTYVFVHSYFTFLSVCLLFYKDSNHPMTAVQNTITQSIIPIQVIDLAVEAFITIISVEELYSSGNPFIALNSSFNGPLSGHERGIVIGLVTITFLLIHPFHGIDRLHVPPLRMIFRVREHTIEQIRIMIDDLFDLITVEVNGFKVFFVLCHIPNTIGTFLERQYYFISSSGTRAG